MSQNSVGRPRKVEEAAEILVEIMDEPKGRRIRGWTECLKKRGHDFSKDTVHRALKLLKSISQEDYQSKGGPIAPRLHSPLEHAGEEGIVRHVPRFGGWYLASQEEAIKEGLNALSRKEDIAANDTRREIERAISKIKHNWGRTFSRIRENPSIRKVLGQIGINIETEGRFYRTLAIFMAKQKGGVPLVRRMEKAFALYDKWERQF